MPALLKSSRVIEAALKTQAIHKNRDWSEVDQTTGVGALQSLLSFRTRPLSMFELSPETVRLPNGKRGETFTEVRAVDQDIGADIILHDFIMVQHTVTVEYELCRNS